MAGLFGKMPASGISIWAQGLWNSISSRNYGCDDHGLVRTAGKLRRYGGDRRADRSEFARYEEEFQKDYRIMAQTGVNFLWVAMGAGLLSAQSLQKFRTFDSP